MIHYAIIERLRSTNPDERSSAIREVVETARRSQQDYDGIVRKVIEDATPILSQSPHPSVYLESLLEIVNRLSDSQTPTSGSFHEISVVSHLRSNEPQLREMEIETLVKKADIGMLHRLSIRYRHFQVIQAVAEALTNIGSPRALKELEQVNLAVLFRDPDLVSRQESISMLAQNKSPQFVRELSLLLLHYDDPAMYQGVIQTLGEIGTQEAIAELVRCNLNAYWEDSGPAIADEAGKALTRVGAACVKPLAKGIDTYVLGAADWQREGRLSCAASTLRGITDPNAVKPLMELYQKYRVHPQLQSAIKSALTNLGVGFDS